MESTLSLTHQSDYGRSFYEEDPGTLANPEPQRSDDGRLMYFEHQLQPCPNYSGCLETLSVDEARALCDDLSRWANVFSPFDFPLPPAGLPGFLHCGYSEDDLAYKLIKIGVRYAAAVLRNERRAMHLRWEDAEDLVRKIKSEAEEALWLQIAERDIKAEQERRSKEPDPQVYFIASASGPIKIGMAKRPAQRLSELQTSHHEKLTILATCEGGQKQERAYHKRFAKHRLQGEWFSRCRAILNEIDRLNGGADAD